MKKVFEVKSARDLSLLLRKFPNAKVTSLLCTANENWRKVWTEVILPWRVEIEIEEDGDVLSDDLKLKEP